MDDEEQLPEGLVKKLEIFDYSIDKMEDILKPFLQVPLNDIREKIKDPLLNVRLDLMVTYAINSLFWAYLVTQGVNAKFHPIRDELKRIQEYMQKVKLAEERKKMARVDTHAVKRFIRNALWQPPAEGESSTNRETEDITEVQDESTDPDCVINEQQNGEKQKKRKHKNHDDPDRKKRRADTGEEQDESPDPDCFINEQQNGEKQKKHKHKNHNDPEKKKKKKKKKKVKQEY